MNKTIKSLAGIILALALVITLAAAMKPAVIKADVPSEIWTYEDLLKIAEDPAGSYILMADIEMSGKNWTPVDFTGSFDGGGHALLNAEITDVGGRTFSTYDGNMVEYDTQFSGFFSSLVNAEVRNLKLLGQVVAVETSCPVFAGSIAGYMDNSTISNCEVYGEVSVKTTGKSFGTGGIAGFGNGTIENTAADVTLVCIDQDVEDKDEQFMGGAYAAGYIDLRNNAVRIDGYDSDHGYVHDGGLAGMYILYPYDNGYAGAILGNTVEGMITFFEDNEDRRAYCEAYIGEIMNWTFAYDEEFEDWNFIRNEIFEYDTDLLPHSCPNPQMTETKTEATGTENGYTEYVCDNCGYTSRAQFTPVSGNEALVAAHTGTQPEEGEKESLAGNGQAAGAGQAGPKGQAEADRGSSGSHTVLILLIIILVLAILVFLILWIAGKKKRRREEELRKRRRRMQQNRRPSRKQK